MLLYVCLIITFLFTISFLFPVYFIISYKDEISVSFQFLFVKKKIPLEIKGKNEDFPTILNELSRIKDKVFDLYSKLNGKIKIASLEIYASVNMSDAFWFPIIYGVINSTIGAFVGTLDSIIGISKNKVKIFVSSSFLDTPATIFGKIVLKTSLFHFLFASTYALFKAIFKGGKNGRKQAK